MSKPDRRQAEQRVENPAQALQFLQDKFVVVCKQREALANDCANLAAQVANRDRYIAEQAEKATSLEAKVAELEAQVTELSKAPSTNLPANPYEEEGSEANGVGGNH